MSRDRPTLLLLALAVLAVGASTLDAQTWVRTYGGSARELYGRGVPTADGGFAVIGHTTEGGRFPLLVKLDAHGAIEWSKVYRPQPSTQLLPWAFQATSDGGFIVSGVIMGNLGDPMDVFVMRLDPEGDVVWTRAYGGVGFDSQDNRANIVELPDGGFAFAAAYDAYGAGALWVQTVDGGGTPTSTRAYRRQGWSVAANDIQRTSDGGFVVVGPTSPSGQYWLQDFLVLRLHSDFSIAWQKTYAMQNTRDLPYAGLRETPDGDLVVGGHLNVATAPQGWLARLDGSTGGIVWQNTYGSWLTGALQMTPEGLVMALAGTAGCGGPIALDSTSGEIVWQSGFHLAGWDSLSWLEPAPGGFFVTGETEGYGSGDLWALRLDARGGVGGDCSLTCTLDVPIAPAALAPVEGGLAEFTASIHTSPLVVAVTTPVVSTNELCFSANELRGTSPAAVWVGLKNSDDQGTSFDMRTELHINSTLVAAGEKLCVTGITRNPTKAKEVTVPVDLIAKEELEPGDELSLTLLTRVGTNPDGSKCAGHSNAVGLRLYYDAVSRQSRFGAEITPDALADHFLHSSGANFFLDTMGPSGTQAKQTDSGPVKFAGGNPWVEIGTWSRSVP